MINNPVGLPDIKTINQIISALESLPGFNCQEGIDRIFGNRELYVRLALHFFNGNHIHQLRCALRDQDTRRAKAEAHAIKGAALNLGFKYIAKLAGDIEQSLENHNHFDTVQMPLEQLADAFICAHHAMPVS